MPQSEQKVRINVWLVDNGGYLKECVMHGTCTDPKKHHDFLQNMKTFAEATWPGARIDMELEGKFPITDMLNLQNIIGVKE